jgi:hypothetical protein
MPATASHVAGRDQVPLAGLRLIASRMVRAYEADVDLGWHLALPTVGMRALRERAPPSGNADKSAGARNHKHARFVTPGRPVRAASVLRACPPSTLLR